LAGDVIMAGMNWRDVEAALNDAVTDPATGWGLGSFGALAEFHRDGEEAAEIAREDGGWRVTTPRGALRVRPHDEMRLVPYEGLSKIRTGWTHGVMVCLPAAAAEFGGAGGLTELGPDPAPLCGGEGELLFDLGLGIGQLQPCLRTGDRALAELLRRHPGTPFLQLPQDAVAAIKAAQPARVFRSRLGRIEVVQEIPDSGGETPMGPHTHVLPELLGREQTQSANVPVPDGWVPCLSFFPPNPARDVWGERKEFDLGAHRRFQDLIERFAPDDIGAAKQAVWRAMADDTGPGDVPAPQSRAARTALRVAIRQWRHLQGESPAWRAWHARYEPNPERAG
jgi:hypothetical protein